MFIFGTLFSLFGTFTNVDYTESRSKLVCFFPGKPSEQLAINNIDWRYRNDAFDLRRTDNPLVEDLSGKKDFDKSNRVVGFNVDIGPQNQSIFKSFSVGQENGLSTAESLQILNDMANQAGGRQGTTQSTSLYNLYKNRSYTCSISMMGNALIQPTMYFNLRYVPMFYGAYYITEVNHNISPGDFSTEITGVRQATYALSKIDDYLQSLKYTFVRNIIDQRRNEIKQEKDTRIREERLLADANNYISSNVKPVNTSIGQSVVLGAPYQTFTQENPTTSYSLTLLNLKTTLNTKTNDENLKIAIFTWFYYISIYNGKLEAKGYNFGGVILQPNKPQWNQPLIDKYFKTKKYFVSVSPSSYSYVIFDSSNSVIDFFIEIFTPRLGELKEINPETLFRFGFVNSSSDKDSALRYFESERNTNDRFDTILKVFENAIRDYKSIQ